MPAYTPLNITSQGKEMSSMPQGINGIAYAVITAEQYNNVNNLAFGTLAGPVVVSIS